MASDVFTGVIRLKLGWVLHFKQLWKIDKAVELEKAKFSSRRRYSSKSCIILVYIIAKRHDFNLSSCGEARKAFSRRDEPRHFFKENGALEKWNVHARLADPLAHCPPVCPPTQWAHTHALEKKEEHFGGMTPQLLNPQSRKGCAVGARFRRNLLMLNNELSTPGSVCQTIQTLAYVTAGTLPTMLLRVAAKQVFQLTESAILDT